MSVSENKFFNLKKNHQKALESIMVSFPKKSRKKCDHKKSMFLKVHFGPTDIFTKN